MSCRRSAKLRHPSGLSRAARRRIVPPGDESRRERECGPAERGGERRGRAVRSGAADEKWRGEAGACGGCGGRAVGGGRAQPAPARRVNRRVRSLTGARAGWCGSRPHTFAARVPRAQSASPSPRAPPSRGPSPRRARSSALTSCRTKPLDTIASATCKRRKNAYGGRPTSPVCSVCSETASVREVSCEYEGSPVWRSRSASVSVSSSPAASRLAATRTAR